MTVADRGAELHQQVLEQIEADVSAATLAPASYLHAHALRAEPEVGKSTRLGRVREELRVTSTQVQRSPAAWPSANVATSEGRPTRAGRQGGVGWQSAVRRATPRVTASGESSPAARIAPSDEDGAL